METALGDANDLCKCLMGGSNDDRNRFVSVMPSTQKRAMGMG